MHYMRENHGGGPTTLKPIWFSCPGDALDKETIDVYPYGAYVIASKSVPPFWI